MRRVRQVARAAAWLLPLATAACLHDAPVGPGPGEAGLRLQARLAASQVDRTIRVRASFLRAEDEVRVELPVSPAEIVVPGGESATQRVTTQLARCFDEGAVDGETGLLCPLDVELTLLDAEGEPLVSQTQDVMVAQGASVVEVPAFALSLASITGSIVNALTGEGLGGVQVRLFAGATPTGEPLATTTATEAGRYLFPDVSPGTYTLEVSGEGLITTTAQVTVEGTGAVTTDLLAAPTPAEGELRIVLTWGAEPRDLDSHLWGPPAAGNYHVFYGRSTAPGFANLDVDDTSGHGPETITITTVAAGRHVYAVHHFSGSASIATSGARVRVFGAAGLLAEFAPPDQEGRLWAVFELDGTTITPINVITPGGPGSTPPGPVVGEVTLSRQPLPAKGPAVPR